MRHQQQLPTRGSNFWGPPGKEFSELDMGNFNFLIKSMFELETLNPCPADDAVLLRPKSQLGYYYE